MMLSDVAALIVAHPSVDSNAAVLMMLAGVLLVYAEFNMPGKVIPGCLGTLLFLGGIFRISQMPLGHLESCWPEPGFWPFSWLCASPSVVCWRLLVSACSWLGCLCSSRVPRQSFPGGRRVARQGFWGRPLSFLAGSRRSRGETSSDPRK
jgi:hypothetical protein